MNIGTRSLLFGIHQVFIHPWFVAYAWWKLYGFPSDPRLWVAFFIHDLGYWGKPNMDGPEGETHPELGAAIMGKLFGQDWGDFCLLHSRHYARERKRNFTQLCVADKLASIIYPRGFYLFLANLTGELHEYKRVAVAREGPAAENLVNHLSGPDWFDEFVKYMTGWITENKDRGDAPPPRRRKYDLVNQDEEKSNQRKSVENSADLP